MGFSNFTLQSAQEQFGLNLKTNESLFPGVRPVDAGPIVHATLETLGQLALSVSPFNMSFLVVNPVAAGTLSNVYASCHKPVCASAAS
jgi:hypothetical protein